MLPVTGYEQPYTQRYRSNSIIDKARSKSISSSRLLHCTLLCGGLLLGYQLYTGWQQCSGDGNKSLCVSVFRNAAHFHDFYRQSNVLGTKNASYSQLIDADKDRYAKDPFQSTLDIDPLDFALPSDIVVEADSPLYEATSYFKQAPGSFGHRADGYGSEADLRGAPYVRASLLRHLIHTLDAFAEETEFVFWLAHGTLLGQYWGEKIMAEDTDVDVQTSIGALHRVREHAGKLFRDRFELQINPHYVIRKSANMNHTELREPNVIDARWVDTLSGHFIDITALATAESVASEGDQSEEAPPPLSEGKISSKGLTLQDKSVHYVKHTSISPLTRCEFEDLLVWCPADIDAILLDEYPNYKSPHHLEWRYNYQRKIFEKMTCDRLLKMYTYPSEADCDQECREVVSHDRILAWMHLIMVEEKHDQCQLEAKYFSEEGEKVSRFYRGVHTGEDPALKMTTNQFDAVGWAREGREMRS